VRTTARRFVAFGIATGRQLVVTHLIRHGLRRLRPILSGSCRHLHGTPRQRLNEVVRSGNKELLMALAETLYDAMIGE